ncbi:TonB-dependent receptor [Gluconacetobacter diazotrophicus PA1 5]|uniref:TonB-dependent receptor n=4 Tax=Gluconacetobacter diazotrophicus TaxID=33996 RepID=A0A7W4NNK6_GLUDI|nr:TonB-dependent receptor [Gluconacetobacter diazotrophicus]ACI52015.1 TonB-dependent receptor [Gluconacetobacter diazotrophicus PA1 5]MBB2157635.1 TonB-dependent receptor [Gluconacetobacter diazotrophicus]TWB05208.1 iron complex outermembrane receptor protein [Gluconacetobacter diazotrophicus]CAP54134.1 putative TonB-dependent receptor [Gluconacetobacter diazotrophicus PA1 5]
MSENSRCPQIYWYICITSCVVGAGMLLPSHTAQAQAVSQAPDQATFTSKSNRHINKPNPASPSARNVVKQAEAITVSGTATPGNSALSISTREHSTVQVFRYSAEQLRETGQTSIYAAIAQLSPAVTSTPFAGIGGNGLNKSMQLRNLGADQTLMLVNGKRRHVDANFNYYQSGQNYGTDPADLSLIPMSAIDHVEIITEGASALYGQDAEAGAVNIVLKQDTHGGTFDLQNSGYYPGDGQTVDGNVDYGMALGRNGGYLNVAAQITNQLRTNRSGPYLGSLYLDPSDPRAAALGRNVQNLSGSPQSLLETVSLNAAYPVAKNFEFYNTSTFAHKDIQEAQTYRAASNDLIIRSFYPNGTQPYLIGTENDFQVNDGIRSSNFLGMEWDIYANYGRDQMANEIRDTDNPTYGLASPRSFSTARFISDELAAGFKSTKFFHTSLLPRPINFSYGFEYRRDSFHIGAGEPASYTDGGATVLDGPDAGHVVAAGAVDKFGVPPLAAGTQVRNVFDGSVNLDFFATRKWEWTLGGHAVGYSDVGAAATGSIGTRYNFTKNFALRANANTGFRPPTLAEEAFFSETTFPTYRTAQLPVNSPWARALGASKLKGEQSRSFSVGADVTLLPNWTLTANLYRISINDRLYNSSLFGGTNIESILAGVGLPNVLYASYYSNPVNTATNGGDISTSYTLHTTSGTFLFSFSVNIADTEITHHNATPGILTALGQTSFNRTNEEFLLHSAPKNIENLSVSWNKGPYSFRVQEQRFGSYTWVASPSLVQTQWTYAGPSYITNLELGYDVFKRWHIAVGAYNAGNHYPTRANAASRAALQNAFIYAGNSPYGFNGGMYYVKTSLKF